MDFEELVSKIKACEKCGLRKGCTQVVPGEGPVSANIMFIGEGPGEQEDKQGLPFVGRSGQFLRGAMLRAGITQDVFITNVVRCRPPDNRDPEPEEIEACWEWTQELLKVVKPKVLVTLGNYSLTTLAYKLGFGSKVRQQKVTKIAGKPIYVEDRHFYCYPMVHPAYAMRGRTKRAEFVGLMRYLAISIPGWLRRQ